MKKRVICILRVKIQNDRLFNSMLQRFQEAKEKSFERGSEFIFENVDSLYYFQKIDINRSGSYIETPKWLKDKKATISPQNTDNDNCFQYSITIALNKLVNIIGKR